LKKKKKKGPKLGFPYNAVIVHVSISNKAKPRRIQSGHVMKSVSEGCHMGMVKTVV
jgi:hypothetical protein